MKNIKAERKLSDLDRIAIEMVGDGFVMSNTIMDKNWRDEFGYSIPGIRTFQRLEKEDYLFFTEEENIFEDCEEKFTSSVYLTKKGKEALRVIKKNNEI